MRAGRRHFSRPSDVDCRGPRTAEERRGPFPTYRWARQPPNRPHGHPQAGGPHYGVVEASEVLYAAPMMTGLGEMPGSADPLFRLNMDMWAM